MSELEMLAAVDDRSRATPPLVVNRLESFTVVDTCDVDEATQKGQVTLGRHTLSVTDPYTFRARVNSVSVGDLNIQFITYGSNVQVVVPPLHDDVGVIVPQSGAVTLQGRTGSLSCVPGDVVLMPHHTPTQMSGTPDFSCLSLRLDVGVLTQHLSRYLATANVKPPKFQPGLLTSSLARVIGGTVELLAGLAEMSRGQLLPTIGNDMRDQMITGLLLAHPHSRTNDLTSPSPVPTPVHLVCRAAEHIRQDPIDCGTVCQIADRFGLSVRALQYGFQHRFGSSPYQFRQAMRLEGARAELLNQTPRVATISSVAYRWGFSSPSRFARDYRKRYGEYPSTSLRRVAKHG